MIRFLGTSVLPVPVREQTRMAAQAALRAKLPAANSEHTRLRTPTPTTSAVTVPSRSTHGVAAASPPPSLPRERTVHRRATNRRQPGDSPAAPSRAAAGPPTTTICTWWVPKLPPPADERRGSDSHGSFFPIVPPPANLIAAARARLAGTVEGGGAAPSAKKARRASTAEARAPVRAAARSVTSRAATPGGSDERGVLHAATPCGDEPGALHAATPCGNEPGALHAATPCGNEPGVLHVATPRGVEQGATSELEAGLRGERRAQKGTSLSEAKRNAVEAVAEVISQGAPRQAAKAMAAKAMAAKAVAEAISQRAPRQAAKAVATKAVAAKAVAGVVSQGAPEQAANAVVVEAKAELARSAAKLSKSAKRRAARVEAARAKAAAADAKAKAKAAKAVAAEASVPTATTPNANSTSPPAGQIRIRSFEELMAEKRRKRGEVACDSAPARAVEVTGVESMDAMGPPAAASGSKRTHAEAATAETASRAQESSDLAPSSAECMAQTATVVRGSTYLAITDAELLDFEETGDEVPYTDIDFDKELMDMEAMIATDQFATPSIGN